MADAAVEQNTERHARDGLTLALSRLRAVGLVLSLAVIIFTVVVAVVTVTGFVGAALMDAGLVSLASLTSTHNVLVVILVGSAIIAALMAVGINQTLITPLRSATAVVNELARDNYDIRMEESQRLTGLSERILALSRIEHVEILPDVEPVAVDEQIRHAVVMLEPKWSAKGVRVDVSADPCVVDGNADHLMQLWTNLLDNAIKFSPEGGGVSVALYGGRQGEEGREADEITCWVSDEGCGMDEVTLAHLFDRFHPGRHEPRLRGQRSGARARQAHRRAAPRQRGRVELAGARLGLRGAAARAPRMKVVRVLLPISPSGIVRSNTD